MNKICNLLTVNCITLGIDLVSRKRAFEEASLLLQAVAGIDHQAIFDGLIARERLGSTNMDNGIAMPHARLAEADTISLCLLRPISPVSWESANNRAVRIIVTIVIPEQTSDEQLDVLRQITRWLEDKETLPLLTAVQDPVEICRALSQWQAPAPEPEALEFPAHDA